MSTPVTEIVKSLTALQAGQVKHLLERGIRIPPQPRVVEEMRQLMLRNALDVRALARTISQDPGITADLFRLTRTAAYSQHAPFDSVEDLVHALGVKQTFNLVQAIAAASSLDVSRNRTAFEAYWARSQAVAQIAMLVANERVTVCNIFPDQAYLAGMFHDCGVPVLMQRFSTYCKEMHLTEPGRWASLAEEDRRFNADHCVVGYLVARHWNLPDFISDAIRYHHDIEQLGQHASRTMVAILQMSIEIYHRYQQVPNPEWEQVAGLVLDELGLHPDSVSEFIDDILEQFHARTH
ncbi:MAG: hypothetical protein RIR00_802 [Pseudomonadota bacterium]|jgi:HD-like signal output (HDOD) protein